MGLISAALLDIQSDYWKNLKERIISECKIPSNKKNIRKLCQELSAEISIKGYSKKYALAKAEKFFFKPKADPKNINTPDIIEKFLLFFESQSSKWNVLFVGGKIQKDFTKHMGIFDTKKITKAPLIYTNNTKYSQFSSQHDPKTSIYSVTVDAFDPHDARERAEFQLNFFTDVCRFHQHDKEYTFKEKAFVYSMENKKSYIIGKQRTPMQCGVTFKNSENIDLFRHTLEILQGAHFSESSVRAFHKVFDFHHAAILSSAYENQLLDLWAALEGFLPPPDNRGDRINWYMNYIMPPLTLTYNEKILTALALSMLNYRSSNVKTILDSVKESKNKILNAIYIISCKEYSQHRQDILACITENPLLRNRLDRISKDFHSTKSIRHTISNHTEKIRLHIQRIYTLRNQIAHNASSLPYIEMLVENLHDYLDTIIISVAIIGKHSESVMNINTAFEKLCTLEKNYKKSIEGNHDITTDNCIKFLFGNNNILTNM